MSANDSAVDHMDIPIDLAGVICTFLHPSEQPCPETLMVPPVKPGTHGFPVAVAFGEITPRATSAFDPQDAVQDGAVIEGGSSCSRALWWEEWSQLAPLLIRQFIASYHTSFLPVKGTLRTQPRA